NISKIDEYAFFECKSLSEIVIPEGVTEIGYASFMNCKNLKEITIPDSVISTGELSFFSCPNIVVTYKGKTYTYAEIGDLYNDINNQ
ncbi:MAG: leucine-rich repeat protein, partial [Oscillospiraceae bacterium]|nr:leucine-rich repeat protein [Oscillospiraceae bacterium]